MKEQMKCILPLSILFSILLSIDLYSETAQTKILSWIVRPLLMPLLLVIFLLNMHDTLRFERIGVSLALIFSCLGDILLMLHGGNLFIFGLLSFLLAHINYIISFVIRIRHEGDALRERLTILILLITSIPFLIYIGFMLFIICPKLISNTKGMKDLIGPVIVYAFVIVSMAYIACLRHRNITGYWCVFIGALVFVSSDTLLAVNKFVTPLPVPGLLVMLTYGIGQYLIVIGTIQASAKHFKVICPTNDQSTETDILVEKTSNSKF